MSDREVELYYQKRQEALDGFIRYAAVSAASGVEESIIQKLREFTLNFASFHGLDLDRDPPMEATVDEAVSKARASGNVPALTGREKAVILQGIYDYAYEQNENGGLERWVDECKFLTYRMREEWNMPKTNAGIFLMPTKRMKDANTAEGRSHVVVLDAAYFQSKEAITKCLQVLPYYTAYLKAEGRNAEAVKLEFLGYTMSNFWYDEMDYMCSMESPDAFINRLAAENPAHQRIITQAGLRLIQAGIQAHIAEEKDDPAAMMLETKQMFKTLSEQVQTGLETDSKGPWVTQRRHKTVPQGAKKITRAKRPER